MFSKSFYLTAIASFCSISILCATFNKVEALIQLKVGDKVIESIIIIDSEAFTQLSMDNENLGFALKLSNATERNEMFLTIPTDNEKPIAHFSTRKGILLGAGLKLNGYRFEKDLAVTFLSVKKIS